MKGKTRVPPDPGVDGVREGILLLVGAGFLIHAIHVNEIRMRNHGVGGFGLAGVHIEWVFFQCVFRLRVGAPLNIDDVVVRAIKLRLREIGKKTLVAAVAVDDKNFLTAIAGHFVSGFLKKVELYLAAVSDSAGLVLGFENLSEIILREDHSIFLVSSRQRSVEHVQQIGTEGQMGAMLFQNADGEQASSLG